MVYCKQAESIRETCSGDPAWARDKGGVVRRKTRGEGTIYTSKETSEKSFPLPDTRSAFFSSKNGRGDLFSCIIFLKHFILIHLFPTMKEYFDKYLK